MEKEKGSKLLTINCNYCNRKIHATMKQFVDGMECPGCGMPVTVGNDDNSGFNSFLHKTQCVNCHHEFDVPLQFSMKYLAVCPQCDSLFIRKNMVFDDSVGDKASDGVRLMELLYPTIPNNLNNELSDATLASDQEKGFLRDMNIKAEKPLSRTVQRLIRQTFDMINVTVMSNYNAILFFDYHIRSKIYMDIAKSSLYRSIYFEKVVSKVDLEPIVRESLGDDELYSALCSIIDVESYEIAVVYIITFAKVVYEKEIDAKTARVLALRAFGRGFGLAIRRSGYFVYSHEENRVKSISKLSIPAMKSFYTQRNKVNEALHELFAAQNFVMPENKGCMGVIIIAGTVLFITGRELFNHWLT